MGGLERSCKKNSVAKFFRRICHINPHQQLERWQRRRSTLLSCAPSDATESLGSALCPFSSSSFHAECQGGTVSRYLSSVLFKADYPPHVCSLIPGQEPAPALAAGPNALLENKTPKRDALLNVLKMKTETNTHKKTGASQKQTTLRHISGCL